MNIKFFPLLLVCGSLFMANVEAAEPFLPFIHAGDPKAPHTVELYWSPSCPQSALSYKDAFLPASIQYSASGMVHFTAVMVARNSEDVAFNRLLMCVPKDNFAGFSAAVMAGRIKDPNQTFANVAQIGTRFGISSLSPEGCASVTGDSIIKSLASRAIDQLKISETPAWFVDGKRIERLYFLRDLDTALASVGVQVSK